MADLKIKAEPTPGGDMRGEPQGTEAGAVKLLALALSPGTAFLLFFVWRASANPFGARRFTLFDDAMISMTYARTFADTGELVWFPGAPRVQGFTNPLWTLYMAGVHWIGLEGSSAALAVSLTGVLVIVASGVFVYLLVVRAMRDTLNARIFAAVAAAAVPLTYPLAYWTLRGMEVGLLALVLMVCIWGAPITRVASAIDRRTVIAGVTGAIGVLTRFDFVILVAGLAACCAVWASGWGLRLRILAVLAGPATVAAGCVLVFQRIYYGQWLPNTYHLKMDGVLPQVRVYRGLLVSGKILPLLIVLIVAFVVAVLRGQQAARRLSVAVLTAVILAAAYSIWVGGDAWESGLQINRYVSVVFPAALALVAVGAAIISQSVGSLRRWALLSLVIVLAGVAAGISTNPYQFRLGYAIGMIVATSVALMALFGAVALRSRFRTGTAGALLVAITAVTLAASIVPALPTYQWLRIGGLHVNDDQGMSQQGQALAAATADSAVIATVWAGAPAYYSSRTMVDLLGKSDRRIALMDTIGPFYPGHNKWDYDYSIRELQPDVVFQLWSMTAKEEERLLEWGYKEGCLDIVGAKPSYFRVDSEKLIWAAIVTCPDEK